MHGCMYGEKPCANDGLIRAKVVILWTVSIAAYLKDFTMD